MFDIDALDPDVNCKIQTSDCKYVSACDLHNTVNADSLSILHVNCRSLKKNCAELTNLLCIAEKKINIIALTETWLDASNEKLYQIDGYSFVCLSRKDKAGGGIAFYVDDSIRYHIRTDLSFIRPSLECLVVEVELGFHRTVPNPIICCLYRPPNTDITVFHKDLSELLRTVTKSKSKLIVLAGDFNLDLLKSDTHSPTGEFLNNLVSFSFLPVINLPTRVTDYSATLIDNFFVNCSNLKLSSAVVYSDISDHYPILIDIGLKINKLKTVASEPKRNYRDGAVKSFIDDLIAADFGSIILNCTYELSNVESEYSNFLNIYAQIFEDNFPRLRQKTKNTSQLPRKPWLTQGLLVSCKKKYKLYAKMRKRPTVYNKTKYTVYKNKLQNLLRKAQRLYYEEKFKKAAGDMKETWKIIRNILNTKTNQINCQEFLEADKSISDPAEIANAFNKFFVNIGGDLAKKLPSTTQKFNDYLQTSVTDSLFLYPTNALEVTNIVTNLNNKTSYGHDEIPLFIFKKSIGAVTEVLVALVNYSLSTGTVPDNLKIAKVCPIFKAGSENLVSNYRPISVLPSFSKLFEKVVYARLEVFVRKKNILTNSQYGFRENHSTFMALLEMQDKLTRAFEAGEYSIGVFIDLQKAFDCLDHSILLSKLSHYGIRGIAHQWFSSYLTNRMQYVSYNSGVSRQKLISCGVPQGSILGPILFIIYINDIVTCSNLLQPIIFADDTNLFMSNKNYAELIGNLNLELDKLNNWFLANMLSLNAKKTNYIVFGNKRRTSALTDIDLFISGCKIERVDNVKFLGTYIDSDFTWTTHITQTAKKLARSIGILYKVRPCLSKITLRTLYNCLVYPYLSYCLIIWGSASSTSLNKLVVCQKRAVRTITGALYRAHTAEIFVREGILTLKNMYNYELLVFMFRHRHNMLPNSCSSYISANIVIPPYNYRHSRTEYCTPLNRTLLRDKFITRVGPLAWAALPTAIQTINTIALFKAKVKEYLITSG
jgi:hypothetical protein